jgi:LPXTG-motif cell wall-anchored protein
MECALEGSRREANMSTTTLIIIILVILLLFGGFGYRRWRR